MRQFGQGGILSAYSIGSDYRLKSAKRIAARPLAISSVWPVERFLPGFKLHRQSENFSQLSHKNLTAEFADKLICLVPCI